MSRLCTVAQMHTFLAVDPLHLMTVWQLRLQAEKLRERIVGCEEELASAKKASAKVLDDASSQMEGLRALNQTVKNMHLLLQLL